MGTDDLTPPVTQDDFSEFAEPPRHKPPPASRQMRSEERSIDSDQGRVDDVIALLRRKREESELKTAADWEFADVWVLASIGTYRRPCSLSEVLGAGDWINHAILTEDEIESALGKLTGAGLLRIFDDWTFELTDDGLTLWSGDGREVLAQIAVVLEQLVDFDPAGRRISLPSGMRDAALEEYRSG